MNIISIDPALYNTGIYTRIEGKESSFSLKNNVNSERAESLQKIYSCFKMILNKTIFNFGLIEDYSFNIKRVKSSMALIEAKAIIKLVFVQADVPLIQIHEATWKSLTIGRSIDKKNDAEKYLSIIIEKYSHIFNNTDEADAYLIYKAASIIAKRTNNLTPVMDRIRNDIKKILDGKG